MNKPKLLEAVAHSWTIAEPDDCVDEAYLFTCPCGKGRILEQHKTRPYGHNHSVIIKCKDCKEKYYASGEGEMRKWRLKPVPPKPKEKPPLTEEELAEQQRKEQREQEKIARRTGRVLDFPETVEDTIE